MNYLTIWIPKQNVVIQKIGKGTLRKVFIRVYRLEIQSCWYFRPSFVNCCPSNLLSGSTFRPDPPFPVSKYSIYRQCVAGRERGVLSHVGDHILQDFNTLYLTRFRTYKIARPPQKKPTKGGASGRQTHAAMSLYRSIFLDILLWCLYS
jgi:hypothetical protein